MCGMNDGTRPETFNGLNDRRTLFEIELETTFHALKNSGTEQPENSHLCVILIPQYSHGDTGYCFSVSAFPPVSSRDRIFTEESGYPVVIALNLSSNVPFSQQWPFEQGRIIHPEQFADAPYYYRPPCEHQVVCFKTRKPL